MCHRFEHLSAASALEHLCPELRQRRPSRLCLCPSWVLRHNTEKLRIVADRGYRGHNAPPDHKFKVYISGQRHGVTETIGRQLRRRSAVEPVIGHAKAEHRMGRNYLAGIHGDAANAILAAAGYNFRRLLAWLAALWRVFIMAILTGARDAPIPAQHSA
jgi:hypothetical protein